MGISVIVCDDVVGGHMVEHMCTCVYMYMIILLKPEYMGTCFFKGMECVTHVKLRGISAILSYFS